MSERYPPPLWIVEQDPRAETLIASGPEGDEATWVALVYDESGMGPSRRMAEEIVRRFNAYDDLRDALSGLLAQVTGPAVVYGDGRGNDGIKDGLSHKEFCDLRDSRINAARAALLR